MGELELEGPVHLVGCGGSGMNALARVLLDRGMALTGSDRKESESIASLRARGASIVVGDHRKETLPTSAKSVIASAAIQETNPEIVAARAMGIPVRRYAEALGLAMADRRGIAIAGTHGKSTTTAMVASTLVLAGRDPSFVVGADVPMLRTSGRGGSGAEFVAEACEYHRSFLSLRYEIAAIINVEAEHLDYFKDFDDVKRAFAGFAARIPSGGTLVLGVGALRVLRDHLESSASTAVKRIVTGVEGDAAADLVASNLRFDEGCARFQLRGPYGSSATTEVSLAVPGRHFVDDALVAAGVLFAVGLTSDEIARGLSAYRGARRRLEEVVDGRIRVLSDYAHHPTELRAVYSALRGSHPGRRLVGVFQPHQASRLKAFLPEFAAALMPFDRVLVSDVYRVRDSEADFKAITANDLAHAIAAGSGNALASGDLISTMERLRSEWRDGDVVVLLGAGDIDDLRDEVAAALSQP